MIASVLPNRPVLAISRAAAAGIAAPILLCALAAADPGTSPAPRTEPSSPASQPRDPPPRVAREIPLRATDGHEFAADLYEPPSSSPSPAVLLVPNLGHDRKRLAGFGAQMAARGYRVLVMDNQGQTRNVLVGKGGIRLLKRRTIEDLDLMLLDVRAAYEALVRAPGVLAGPQVAIVGVGIGADLGLMFAGRKPEVPAAGFLFPGFGCEGFDVVALLGRLGPRRAILIDSERRQATDFAKGFDAKAGSVRPPVWEHAVVPINTIQEGEDEISGHPGLDQTVLEWLGRALPLPPTAPGGR